jgi:cytochrome c553
MSSRRIWATSAILAGLCALGILPQLAAADELYDLGEYLSGDCTACHQLKGNSPGIPAITGWDVDSFVMVMRAYRMGERDHTLMQTVARRFSDEDLKALAVFFGKQ